MSSFRQLANNLPDLPRWVEVRDFLLEEEGEIFGVEKQVVPTFVLLSTEDEVVYVIGEPSASAIQQAVTDLSSDGSLIVPSEHMANVATIFPEWKHEHIFVYTLPSDASLPQPNTEIVRLIDTDDLTGGAIPDDLLEELTNAAEYSPIASVFVENKPVSFCYAASKTKTLWDVSIDTLEEHRQRGYAGQCFSYMASHMRNLGKSPVWQSLESNPASWRLAMKLGFTQVDELTIFYRP